MADLTEIDSLEFRVLVNDQLDNIAPSWHPEVQARGMFSHIPMHMLDQETSQARGNAKVELYLPNSCCGVHGLSLMITATKGSTKHTLLFDAGPEGEIWRKNVERLKLTKAIGDIELIHLSHWHRDHSGGLEEAIKMITAAKGTDNTTNKVIIDLHPNRPGFRGFMLPTGPVSLEADPTFEELSASGATISKNASTHTVLDSTFLISGEIPRTTPYETGITHGVRFDNAQSGWEKDEAIADERFVMCNLKGKGLVVFTGCSHAGLVNVARHAVEIGDGVPLYNLVGGFHLSDAPKEKLKSTVQDLKKLQPKVLMPGHCSGWRIQVEVDKEMPDISVPLYCGQVYRLSS